MLRILRKIQKYLVDSRRLYSNSSYKHHLGEEPLRYITIGRLLEEAVQKYGDRPYLISRPEKKTLSFQDTLEKADKLAAGLLKIGLRKGDRLGLWSHNNSEWIITKMACARAGLIMVAINPAYQKNEMEYCINKVGIKAIVCEPEVGKQNFYGLLTTICSNIENSDPGKLKSSKVPSLESVIIISNQNLKGTFIFEEVASESNEKEVDFIRRYQEKVQPDDAYNIQFTSGTTGKPKAAVMSHYGLVNNSFYIAKRNEIEGHKMCIQNPFFHAYGIVITIMASLHYGSTMVIPSKTYNPDAFLDAIKEERCTILNGTPTMYVDLIARQKERKEKISPEIAICGGAPCAPFLFRQMIEVLGVKKVKSVYGLTETTAVAFQSLPGDDEYKSTDTVGHLQEHLEAKVVDKDNNVVPIGTPGELCIRGYVNMLGYWDDEEKTRDMIGRDRWLKTGDQFVLQKDGYGKVVGRLKEMIIRGGENIFPREIEDFLNTHPDVLETQVIGLPHERLGEEVCAFLRTRSDVQLTQEDIKEYCKGNISHFKIPSKVFLVDEFPRTPSGKIQKFKLKESITPK